MADHDHKSHELDPTFRKEEVSPDDQYSGAHRINNVQSSANLSSMNYAGQISIPSSSSLSNENPSSTIVSTQSSNSVLYRVDVPSKNDISSKLGPLVQRESSMVDAVKSEERQKHMTESSCSNSIQTTLPVSSSNESYLEMPTEMRSAKPHTLGVNSCISEGFGSSMEGPVTRGTVSHIAPQTEEPAPTFSRKCEGLGSWYLDIVDQELMKQQSFSNPQPPLKVPCPVGLCEINGFNVIRVVAKPGIPPSIPMPHRKLEGEMSWKGSAATSAFRPTTSNVQASQRDCTPTFSKGFPGIDLNVAAQDDDEHEFAFGSWNPALKVGCCKAERLDFDLNCLGDITDMSQVASLPATSVKTEIVDFNLNKGFSTIDKRDDCRWQNKPSQHIAKLPPNSPGVYIPSNSGGYSFNLTRPAYRTDLNNIQFYNQSQMQSFLMGSSNAVRPVQLQPKLPFVIPSLPPQSYPSSGPFFICPNGLVPPNLQYPIPMQHARDPRLHANIPQNIGQTMVSSVPGGPHFMQAFHGRSQTEVANIRPCMDVVNGGIPAINGSPRDTRQFFPPSRCSPVKEQMRVQLKRTEPEGGHETLQLCTRQLTSWN